MEDAREAGSLLPLSRKSIVLPKPQPERATLLRRKRRAREMRSRTVTVCFSGNIPREWFVRFENTCLNLGITKSEGVRRAVKKWLREREEKRGIE